MRKTVHDKGALSRETHAQYNFAEIYPPRILSAVPKRGVVMDIGTGIARDAMAMHDRANGRLLVIGIDPEEANYRRAVKTYRHKDIVLCRDWNDVACVERNRQIAYLVAEVQNLSAPPPKLKADFINCAAVMMFVPSEEHEAFLGNLYRLAKPYRDVFLRLRTEMLKDGMVRIDLKSLHKQCRMAGFFMERMPDFPDPPPTSRPFIWRDRMLTTVPKP